MKAEDGRYVKDSLHTGFSIMSEKPGIIRLNYQIVRTIRNYNKAAAKTANYNHDKENSNKTGCLMVDKMLKFNKRSVKIR